MSKKRNILLIEPKYRNKYPPIGLMKIATYHKMLGDNVKFFKGDLKDLVLDQMTENCIDKFYKIDKEREWKNSFTLIRDFIKSRKATVLEELDLGISKYNALLHNAIYSFADTYRKKDYDNFPKWDRI